MMKRTTRVIGGIAAIGIAVTLGSSLSMIASAKDSRATTFERNASGQTFGSALNAEVDPDLILAQGVDGTIGYVRAADLNGPDFTSPEEAVAYQEANRRLEGGLIPLYASDGVTVIGEFLVSATILGDIPAP